MRLLRRLFNRLPFKLRYEMFYQAARSLGVQSYGIAGPSGFYAGPVADVTITKSYLQGVVWARREIDVIKSFFVGKPGTLYDVGANIGTVAIPLAQAGVNVVAFEAHPLNCSLLRSNIAVQKADRIDVRENAVYRERSMLRFEESLYNSGDHRISDDGGIEVQGMALDDLPIPDCPFAVKIDTQGAEPGVFEGGQKTIAAAGMVLSEFWPFGIDRMGNQPDAILEAVRSFPYGRLIDRVETPWMPGAELADKLHALSKDQRRANEVDFVVAKEKF